MTSLRTAVAFREARRPSTLPAHNREHTSMAAHHHVALLLLPMNVQSSSACSSMISKSRNIRWLKRFAAGLGHLKAHSSPIVNRQAKAAVRCPRVRADRSPADRAAVPPASAPLRRKRAVAHDVEAQFSTVVTPALGAGHPVDRVHRSRVPGGNPRFSPTISEVKATDQQRPAQAPAKRPRPPKPGTVSSR